MGSSSNITGGNRRMGVAVNFGPSQHHLFVIMKTLLFLCGLVCLAMSAPAAQVAYPYGLYPYAAAPVVAYAPALDSGLVYPVAEAYVHDVTGDTADNSYPEAEPYVHDATGDA